MRIFVFLFTIITHLFCNAMESNNQSYVGQFIHLIDKTYINRVQYITDIQSKELCETMLSYDPNNPKPKKLKLDSETFLELHRVFEREQKLLLEVEEAICKKNSYAEIEQIRRDVEPGYYSPNCFAIIQGYLESKIQRAEADTQKLKNYQNLTLSPKNLGLQAGSAAQAPSSTLHNAGTNSPGVVSPHSNNATSKEQQEETDFISPSALHQLILESNPTFTTKFFNYLRKSFTDTLGYLTNSKSTIVSRAVLHFSPDHDYHWLLNNALPLHQALIHNAIERQIRLLDMIEYLLKQNDYKSIVQVHTKTGTGYFSKILQAIIKGYLASATDEKVNDTNIRKEQAETSGLTIAEKKAPDASLEKKPNAEVKSQDILTALASEQSSANAQKAPALISPETIINPAEQFFNDITKKSAATPTIDHPLGTTAAHAEKSQDPIAKPAATVATPKQAGALPMASKK